jgi:site-specific recombinase XerC
MLDTVRPFHVAAYIEQMPGSKPTIKQKLAAIRMLYDFLVIRQLVPINPTASVRGPKYVVKRGKTPAGVVRTLRSFWNRFRAMT